MKIVRYLIIILLFNFLLITFSIIDGVKREDLSLRFQERQAVTFFSSLLLGLSGLISLVIYLLKRKIPSSSRSVQFWLICSLGFFYLCLDEYFMIHEGLDNLVIFLFKYSGAKSYWDFLPLVLFGLIGIGVCLFYRKELLGHKEIFPFLFLGGLSFLGTVTFHILYPLYNNDILIVVEESFKILGVSFFFGGYLFSLISLIRKIKIS